MEHLGENEKEDVQIPNKEIPDESNKEHHPAYDDIPITRVIINATKETNKKHKARELKVAP